MKLKAEWNDYRVFLAIARHGSLSEAARSLGQSQPTMGRRLQALEQALSHTLFQRTADGYVLTSEGEAILPHAQEIEEQAVAIERKLAGAAALHGMVRVSTTEWFGAHVLSPVFAQVRAAHPELVIELLTETRLVSLARREADLGFRFREFDEADVVQTRATELGFGAYASPDYLTRHGAPDEGGGHTLVTMDTAYGDLADVPWLAARLPRAAVGLRANSRDVQARLCAAGAGIAVLPRVVGDAMPGLTLLDLGAAPPGRVVWAGYHKDLQRSLPIRTVLSAVRAALGSRPV
ncbi:LysR family transcriptional regulator [Massilia sp. KIM]|uniref:LysR family transcriptional regulator n=1 Tax=Massilia sp. KIM TaxID=1955422 RepID=UPI00098EDD6C|nr:LysR family transcriptional regulator [Massilia sp. KIM]OON64512.1 LysR family transcriptional regulator [Massilia sp. KIM]